jgi:hypothetical protein
MGFALEFDDVTLNGFDRKTLENVLVHDWRTGQLEQLGISRTLAAIYAGRVDWHDVADLVSRGCPPDLALDICR